MLLYILGRQPEIGLAELESLYGAPSLRPTGNCVVIETENEITFKRIGGALKVGRIITTFDTTDWNAIQKRLLQITPTITAQLAEGKLRLGMSVYGFSLRPQKIMATGLALKKAIGSSGRSVRLVPNQTADLNSAQVLYNKLTQARGVELLVVKDGNKTILAQTTGVQDIEAYTKRDRGRPKRDARVGMLPPKLAQILINLSELSLAPSHQSSANTLVTGDKRLVTTKPKVLLDPFCGTGVVLQEAALMGWQVRGSDLDQRMVDYTQQNLEWLKTTHHIHFQSFIEQGDARDNQWQPPIHAVVSETYLGRPFTNLPAHDILQTTINDCNVILTKFLKNIATQLTSGTSLCLAVPAWFVRGTVYHLPVIDSPASLGYNRIDFVHATRSDLIYHREGQIVGRELLVLAKK